MFIDVTALLLAHHGQHGARHVEKAEDIGVEHAAHVGVARFLDGREQPEARVVDQHVDAAELRDGGFDGGFAPAPRS